MVAVQHEGDEQYEGVVRRKFFQALQSAGRVQRSPDFGEEAQINREFRDWFRQNVDDIIVVI